MTWSECCGYVMAFSAACQRHILYIYMIILLSSSQLLHCNMYSAFDQLVFLILCSHTIVLYHKFTKQTIVLS